MTLNKYGNRATINEFKPSFKKNSTIGIVGGKYTGKTNLIIDLLLLSNLKDNPTIVLCKDNKEYSLVNDVINREYDVYTCGNIKEVERKITEIINSQREKELITPQSRNNSINLVIDDVFNTNARKIGDIFRNNKSYNINLIYTLKILNLQNLPMEIKIHTDYLFAFKENYFFEKTLPKPLLEFFGRWGFPKLYADIDCKKLYRTFFYVYMSFTDFKNIYSYNLNTPYKCIVFDNSSFGKYKIEDVVFVYKANIPTAIEIKKIKSMINK